MEKKLPLLKKLILIGDIYGASFGVFGCLMSFFAGALSIGTEFPWYLFALAFVYMGLDIIRPRRAKIDFNEQREYLTFSIKIFIKYKIIPSLATNYQAYIEIGG
jgi:hypothetical protein